MTRIAGDKVKTSLRVSLSRYSGSSQGWTLAIEDEVSGLLVLDIDLDNDAIADLVSSRFVHAENSNIWKDNADKWGGFKKEHRYVKFFVPQGGDFQLQQAEAAIKESAEGWTMHMEDHPNLHHMNQGEYTGMSWRWVPINQ